MFFVCFFTICQQILLGFTDDFSKLLSSFLPAGDNLDYKSWPILERLPKKDDNEVHGDWWYKIYAHLTLLDVQPLFLFQIDPNSGLIHVSLLQTMYF